MAASYFGENKQVCTIRAFLFKTESVSFDQA